MQVLTIQLKWLNLQVQIIRNSENKGLDFPIKTGISHAMDSAILLFMDISICHEPKLIAKMLEPIQKIILM